MDRDREGLASTSSALSAAGIRHAGAGVDLAAAQAAAVLGDARRIALVAVTASAAPAARASASRPDIAGRPGVQPLEYSASITVDPGTFATLAQSVRALEAGPPPGERELSLFGTRIVRGDRIQVDVALNRPSAAAVLEAVQRLRDSGALVIVSVHSHEPSNGSEEPAGFLREFAHAAVDAGARIVVGHGPHRIRGGEVYNGGVVFYSLGTFLFAAGEAGLGEPDPFDGGQDLFRMALGALDREPARLEDPLAAEWWWQGLMAVVTVDGDRLTRIRVHPLDLPRGGSGGDAEGLPRLASGPVGRAILTRFSGLWTGAGEPFQLADDGSALERPIP
jgi:poly-gamma-glutamate synthesis protein (capsule biosynthesis protein)